MPNVSSSDVALVLKHAYGLIEEGWCKGTFSTRYTDGRTEYCILGALTQAGDNLGVRSWQGAAQLHCAAATAINDTLIEEGTFLPVSAFNDFPTTTKKDVLRVIEKAIERVVSE